MTQHHNHTVPVAPRRAAVSLVALIITCMLTAGCGGTSPSHASTPNVSVQALAFSKCIRAHGVTDFPDPGANISGPHSSIAGIAIPPTINLQSPAYRTAQSACSGLLSAVFSNQGKPGITAATKASLIAHAQCMRTHGVPGYLDPTFPPTGGISFTDGPGVDPQSPAYQHALAICGGG